MMLPTYRNLRRAADSAHPTVVLCSGSPGPQGNPRLYKYFWQVFSLACPWEDGDFFRHAPVLGNAACEKEIQRLLACKLSCLVYGFRRPRKDPDHPWDLSHPRWANVDFAVSWDADSDLIVHGGHK